MRNLLSIFILLCGVNTVFAATGTKFPGGIIPTDGAFGRLTVDIGALPPLKGGYTIVCKMTNPGEDRRLYADVYEETASTMNRLSVRPGKNAFYFGIEGTKHGRVVFSDYAAPGTAEIVVQYCKIHASPNN